MQHRQLYRRMPISTSWAYLVFTITSAKWWPFSIPSGARLTTAPRFGACALEEDWGLSVGFQMGAWQFLEEIATWGCLKWRIPLNHLVSIIWRYPYFKIPPFVYRKIIYEWMPMWVCPLRLWLEKIVARVAPEIQGPSTSKTYRRFEYEGLRWNEGSLW